ncbi:MAG: hypothetical protein M1838_004632 [Thelocarpon superellum]|nr:MAG: hypothetical protein M1838_004632 [Thelocarpon superellum]
MGGAVVRVDDADLGAGEPVMGAIRLPAHDDPVHDDELDRSLVSIVVGDANDDLVPAREPDNVGVDLDAVHYFEHDDVVPDLDLLL